MKSEKLRTANAAWFERIYSLMEDDDVIVAAPRGMPIREQLHQTVVVDIEHALLLLPERKLNYKFAAAEALWIIDADDKVASLTPYNKRMAEFSDDGVTLAGAYGPRLEGQIDYVIEALTRDPDTRQAVSVIWRPNPRPSRDIPCTLALSFMTRAGALHVHAYMRSSDVWLGLPYDLFSFACYGLHVMHTLREQTGRDLRAGSLYLTAASSHIYDEHAKAAASIIELPMASVLKHAQDPIQALHSKSNDELRDALVRMRDTGIQS